MNEKINISIRFNKNSEVMTFGCGQFVGQSAVCFDFSNDSLCPLIATLPQNQHRLNSVSKRLTASSAPQISTIKLLDVEEIDTMPRQMSWSMLFVVNAIF
ncbi:hypothetical protein T4B_1944 [Trichinella pseudospiralis]|uniref:Uncharacterized protein n=1 Tax=Trichinella pseudospiralis TaxID=6337 RepID=A0A0V1J9K7_TRIPS|nr:hypothetical protein T4B_1944 [Trichinella pseudospiralis]